MITKGSNYTKNIQETETCIKNQLIMHVIFVYVFMPLSFYSLLPVYVMLLQLTTSICYVFTAYYQYMLCFTAYYQYMLCFYCLLPVYVMFLQLTTSICYVFTAYYQYMLWVLIVLQRCRLICDCFMHMYHLNL